MSAQIQPRWLSVEDYPAGRLGSINEKSSSPTLGWTACKVICCWKQDRSALPRIGVKTATGGEQNSVIRARN